MRSVGGAVTERTIGGPTCAEVAEALAVMVAVVIDPRAGSGAAVDEAPPPPKIEGRRAGPTPSRPPRPSPERPPAAARWPRFAVDLRVETTSAVFRGALAGIGASLTVEPPAPPPRRGVYVSVPSVAAGVRRSFPMERALRGGSVDFAWTAGTFGSAPSGSPSTGLAEVSPCAEANVGSLRASARGFAEARGTSTLWFDLGASLGTTVSLSGSLFLSSTVLVSMPLFRQPFSSRAARGSPASRPWGSWAGSVSGSECKRSRFFAISPPRWLHYRA